MFTPRIEHIEAKSLIGMSMTMSVSTAHKTGELFRNFMPRRKEIPNTFNPFTLDLRVYPSGYFAAFNPTTDFTKWALAEVSAVSEIPKGMKLFDLPAGQYAIFDYKGISGDPSIFQYIFTEWLPSSEFQLDDRPHFEVLGPKTKLNDPESEEEIWVPLKS